MAIYRADSPMRSPSGRMLEVGETFKWTFPEGTKLRNCTLISDQIAQKVSIKKEEAPMPDFVSGIGAPTVGEASGVVESRGRGRPPKAK